MTYPACKRNGKKIGPHFKNYIQRTMHLTTHAPAYLNHLQHPFKLFNILILQ